MERETAYLEQIEDERCDEDFVEMNVLVLQDVLQRTVSRRITAISIFYCVFLAL